MRAPGFDTHPNHRVDIQPVDGRVVVRVGDALVADSHSALLVSESHHDRVYYLPFEDIQATTLTPTGTETYCPFKGTASYWNLNVANTHLADAVWGYQSPYDECAPLAGYAAFYIERYPDEITLHLT